MLINAAFESGGIKGLAYLGALKYLEERGIKIYQASGSSVGALFASLVIAGYCYKEIYDEIENIDIDTLLKRNTFINIIKNIGVNNIDNLEEKLNNLLIKKGYYKFKDTKKGYDYLLKIATTDYSSRKKVILPDDYKLMGYDPDEQIISKAVAMSCSVPLFYSVYKYKEKMFGDGGILNKFPVDVLNNKYPVFAFKISSSRPIYCFKEESDESLREKNIHIIKIDTCNINSLNFKKGLENRMLLYKNGYLATKNYFEKYINKAF